MNEDRILVCGAGIVGLAAALALARRGQPVAILAPRVALPPADPQHYHPRVYALSPASQQFLQDLGVWDAMPAERIAPVEAMEIHGDAGGQVSLHAWQAARTQLAWIVEASELECVLGQAARLSGIPWIEDRCAGYENGMLLTETGRRLAAPLIVGADGAESPLRAAAGLAVQSRQYDAIGLVAHFDTELPHQATALQWFRDDGVLALLPLPDTARGPQVSMVWSMQADLARELQAMERALLATALQEKLHQATGRRLGTMTMQGRLYGFPLYLEQAQLVAPGVALAGDAAHRVHPLAGQGLNLGLDDAHVLATIVAQREPYRAAGDMRVLRRYQRARAEPLAAMRLATDGLQRLFASHAAPLAWLRNAGMGWLDRLPMLKRRLIEEASGTQDFRSRS